MTVLFTPLGLAYGTLYSAILLVRPQRVIVVTSPQAIIHLPATLDAVRFYYDHFEVETRLLDSPLDGFGEGRQLAHELACLADEENVINLTGGTTVLQDCVRSVADILRDLDKSAREVAVIDRRPAAEQSRTPFTVGELVEIPPL